MKIIPAKLLCLSTLTCSQGESRRCIVGKIVKLNNVPVIDISIELEVQPGDVLSVGKKQITLTSKMLENQDG